MDGVDGSGKTTFADCLAAKYVDVGRTAHLVHMDDFLNPREVRYRCGKDSPEGFFRDTYDLSALTARVIEPLYDAGHRQIVRKAFDYRADEPAEDDPIDVAPEDVVIVEGKFMHRDELLGTWDVSVFLNVPFAVSVARMAERDGTCPDPDDPSVHRYVEGQRIYLAACTPSLRATWVIAND